MNVVRRAVRKILPAQAQASFINREKQSLGSVNTLPCDTSHLGVMSADKLQEILNAPDILYEWPDAEKEIMMLNFPIDSMGSMNVGDRRTIYHLVKYLRPGNVLEIGTHIGSSTAHFACALKRLGKEEPQKPYKLTTVDVVDVNDPLAKRWLKYGSAHSPQQLVKKLGCQDRVTFIKQPSESYLATCPEKYDLIFLDGDHSAVAVYREIPAALKALAPGGYILLHDVYPNLQPLWSNGVVIPGPWLATQRHLETTPDLAVLPLGALPWPTKLGSTVTSLALLGRAG